jgi:hypothetical protein
LAEDCCRTPLSMVALARARTASCCCAADRTCCACVCCRPLIPSVERAVGAESDVEYTGGCCCAKCRVDTAGPPRPPPPVPPPAAMAATRAEACCRYACAEGMAAELPSARASLRGLAPPVPPVRMLPPAPCCSGAPEAAPSACCCCFQAPSPETIGHSEAAVAPQDSFGATAALLVGPPAAADSRRMSSPTASVSDCAGGGTKEGCCCCCCNGRMTLCGGCEVAPPEAGSAAPPAPLFRGGGRMGLSSAAVAPLLPAPAAEGRLKLAPCFMAGLAEIPDPPDAKGDDAGLPDDGVRHAGESTSELAVGAAAAPTPPPPVLPPPEEETCNGGLWVSRGLSEAGPAPAPPAAARVAAFLTRIERRGDSVTVGGWAASPSVNPDTLRTGDVDWAGAVAAAVPAGGLLLLGDAPGCLGGLEAACCCCCCAAAASLAPAAPFSSATGCGCGRARGRAT